MKAAKDILADISKNGNHCTEEFPEFFAFYDVEYNSDNEVRKVKINYFKLVQLLKMMGFRRLDVGRQSFTVKVKDNVVEECEQKDVIDTFINYLESFPVNFEDGVMRDAMINKVYGGLSTYFSENILKRLVDEQPIQFNEHNRTAAFYYYRNGYVKVTAKKLELLPYHTLDKMIWKNQILDRDFKLLKPNQYSKSNFYQFVSNISNNYINENTKKPNDPARFECFRSIIGYCLHSYFEGKLKAIVLTDSRMSEDASGRTGKTLVCKAMGHILNTNKFSKTFVELNGKDFDIKDRFRYQELRIDTRLVHINDLSKYFNFEALFNDITEGIKSQHKNELPFLVMAKMLLSTNRTIRIHGDSAKDRSIEFEMADYYGADFSPEKEFNQWFFRDWTKGEWNQFDNFMISCVQLYLKKGLMIPQSINLLTRKLQEETTSYFVDFMDDLKINHGSEFNKKELHEKFKEEYTDYRKLTRNTFTKWLKLYAEYKPEFEGYEERRSNSIDFIKYLFVEELRPKEEEDIPEGW